MLTYPTAVAAALAARGGICARVLVWLSAKNRDTGAVETIGFWSGDDHRSFTIGGQTRLYYGAGAMLDVGQVTRETGLTVRTLDVSLSPIAPEVQMAIRGYEPRLAPAEVHHAFFDPASGALLATPTRVWKGWIDGVQIQTPEEGGEASCTVSIASNSMVLTRKVPLKKSDESQRRRNAADAFFKHADISGQTRIVWGTEDGVSKKPSAITWTPPGR